MKAVNQSYEAAKETVKALSAAGANLALMPPDSAAAQQAVVTSLRRRSTEEG